MRVSLLQHPSPGPPAAELCLAALPAGPLFQEGWGWLDWRLPCLPPSPEREGLGAGEGAQPVMRVQRQRPFLQQPFLFSRLFSDFQLGFQ